RPATIPVQNLYPRIPHAVASKPKWPGDGESAQRRFGGVCSLLRGEFVAREPARSRRVVEPVGAAGVSRCDPAGSAAPLAQRPTTIPGDLSGRLAATGVRSADDARPPGE